MKTKERAERLLQQTKEVPDKVEALQLVHGELKKLKASGEITDREVADIYRVIASTDRRFRRAVVDKDMLDRETLEALILLASAKRLAKLGGTEKELEAIPRRRREEL